MDRIYSQSKNEYEYVEDKRLQRIVQNSIMEKHEAVNSIPTGKGYMLVDAPVNMLDLDKVMPNPSYSDSGITYTKNSDGSYSRVGTSTATYTSWFAYKSLSILLKKGHTYCVSGIDLYDNTLTKRYMGKLDGTPTFYTMTEDVTITTSAPLSFGAKVGVVLNDKIYPYLYESTKDYGFIPPKGELKVVGENLLNPTINTQTRYGVTCTRNADNTFTLNGTVEKSTNFVLDYFYLKEKTKYKIVGAPSNSSSDTFYIGFGRNTSWDDTAYDYGNGAVITTSPSNGNQYYMWIAVTAGTVFNNVVFKPMITFDMNATYNSFKPYEKTIIPFDSTTSMPIVAPAYDGQTNLITDYDTLFDVSLPINVDDSLKKVNSIMWGMTPKALSVTNVETNKGYMLVDAPINEIDITATTQTVYGVTFTVDKVKGTVTANGTASGRSFFKVAELTNIELNNQYTISGCPSLGSKGFIYDDANAQQSKDIGSGATYTPTKQPKIYICIESGTVCNNLVFRPMLVKGTRNRGFIPKGGTDVRVVGQNLLEVNKATTLTNNGVTFTVNSDKTITIKGTASTTIAYMVANNKIENGIYRFSGGISNNVRIQINNHANDTNIGTDRGGGITVNITDNGYVYYLVIEKGTTVDSEIIKPMLVKGSTALPFKPYEETTISFTDDTPRPIIMPCYDGQTNLITDCGTLFDVGISIEQYLNQIMSNSTPTSIDVDAVEDTENE